MRKLEPREIKTFPVSLNLMVEPGLELCHLVLNPIPQGVWPHTEFYTWKGAWKETEIQRALRSGAPWSKVTQKRRTLFFWPLDPCTCPECSWLHLISSTTAHAVLKISLLCTAFSNIHLPASGAGCSPLPRWLLDSKLKLSSFLFFPEELPSVENNGNMWRHIRNFRKQMEIQPCFFKDELRKRTCVIYFSNKNGPVFDTKTLDGWRDQFDKAEYGAS